jgi:hypothetical protein
VQHEAPDRIGGEAAVVEELGLRRVAEHALVAPVRLDEARERLARQRARAERRREAAEQRMAREVREGALEILLERVERGEPVARVLVADEVDEAREAVDREQVLAVGAGQEAERDREVLGARAGEDLLRRGA